MAKKFGTFKGVFVPSFEALLGTVLFLLLPALVGDAGLLPMIGVILLAHSVSLATAFSLSDCATNLNNIGGGGMYAISKRSLGKAFGASIGIQLYLAQTASIGFYAIGFAEPLQPVLAPLLSHTFPVFAGTDILLQKQIIASIMFVLFFIIVMIGADFTLKIQTLILVILSGSILAIFFSPLLHLQFANTTLFRPISQINLNGNRPLTLALFFSTFAIFFPAVTGIDAGIGMSGDLKDPKKSIVTGTFTAILITFAIYTVSTFIFSLIDPKLLVTGYVKGSPMGHLLPNLLGVKSLFPANLPGIMVIVGILFATSSSALSVFMTSPRTAQSLARDNTLPKFLSFLKYDFFPKGNEPRFATLVSAVIGFSIIWMGSINLAASIVGILYLLVYAWVNGSAFLERVSHNPAFRPTFKGNWLISLYGFSSSIIAIALFDWKVGIAIFVSQFIIFALILKYKAQNRLEGVWWGVLFSVIQSSLRSLSKIVQGTKNWRPILSAFSFLDQNTNPEAVEKIAYSIANFKGMVNLNILINEKQKQASYPLLKFRIPNEVILTQSPTAAIIGMIQASHPGGLQPNTVLLEHKRNLETVRIIQMALKRRYNFLLLKNGEKLLSLKTIDIWWRGFYNANLMALLAYIIKSSIPREEQNDFRLRILTRLGKDDSKEAVQQNMLNTLSKARLNGEILVLDWSEDPILKTVSEHSTTADLIMMGLPGNYEKEKTLDIFHISEVFFDREIETYSTLPTVLFVKSAQKVNLLEDA